jgi:hypothetical protein
MRTQTKTSGIESVSLTPMELHTPGTVKLWESPGRAGGLPNYNYKFLLI